MRARSFSHAGITVSDFNAAVKFYWDVFGCPLVGVADTPSDRVRSFFGVDADTPTCKIGWIFVRFSMHRQLRVNRSVSKF